MKGHGDVVAQTHNRLKIRANQWYTMTARRRGRAYRNLRLLIYKAAHCCGGAMGGAQGGLVCGQPATQAVFPSFSCGVWAQSEEVPNLGAIEGRVKQGRAGGNAWGGGRGAARCLFDAAASAHRHVQFEWAEKVQRGQPVVRGGGGRAARHGGGIFSLLKQNVK